MNKRSDVYAHRVAFYLANGYWPMPVARHTCDNPPCCNPAHIIAGTVKQNNQDKVERGRTVNACGELAHQAKLTAYQVRRIREMYASGSLQREVGALFGISQAEVSRIVRGKRWATYEGPN